MGPGDITDAAERLARFAPCISQIFPETAVNHGIIESPIVPIPHAKKALQKMTGQQLPGKLMLKCDNSLPVSGSIKARGGTYAVLKYAETIALEAGLLKTSDNYLKLNSETCRTFFGEHQVITGSTGNLGLSIGIISTQLGFKATVHMAADARQWKKIFCDCKGVHVVEHRGDYSKAVREARRQARTANRSYFIDDEKSIDLFLGYSVAAQRLAQQFLEQGIMVDEHHPLFVYLPCGVGGSPGGVTFGLKQIFGDDVHCFFAEPTHSACMFIGMYTGLHDKISVADFGVDNITCADGLAVGRPSAFVGRLMDRC